MACDRSTRLSPAGAARREAMLGDLVAAMELHHHRRLVRRNVALMSALAMVVVGAAYFVATANSSTPPAAAQLAQHTTETALDVAPAGMRLVHVQTDPAVLDRYRAEASGLIACVDDTELLETLRRFDRPAGLVRMGEEVFVTASVVDESSDDAARPSSL